MTPTHAAPVPDLTTALAMLQHDSAAVALCDAQGRVEWCNAALLDAIGQPSDSAHGQRLAIGWVCRRPMPRCWKRRWPQPGRRCCRTCAWPAQGAARPWWRAHLHTLPEGQRLVRWMPHRRAAACKPPKPSRLTELLELAQDFGRLGVWERDARTLQGRWDHHVHRISGLPDGALTPNFGVAAQSIVDEDRAALESAFDESLRRSGSYAHRYRVRTADGSLRHLRSHWAVKDGDDGMPARVLGILVDDTEAFDLARAHTETLEQLRLALEMGNIVHWRHDLQAHRCGSATAPSRCWGWTSRSPKSARSNCASLCTLTTATGCAKRWNGH